jgi:putative membrane protein
MFKNLLIAASLVCAAMLGVSVAHAEDYSAQDRHFVADAASGGMLEVRLGEYAARHATSDEVKRFGQHMVDDHSKANDRLKAVASNGTVEIPKDMSDDDKRVMDRLRAMTDQEFDKAYVHQMVEDHRKDIAAFEKEASDGHNSELRDFASKTLPVLRHHLEMAEDLNKKMGA